MNSKRLLLVFLVPLALLGSSCTTSAKPKNFYPADNNPPWVFSGSLHGTSGKIIITINDEVVQQGDIASFSESIQLTGTYQDKEILSNCKMQYCSGGMQCTVYVDSKPAVLLDFSGL